MGPGCTHQQSWTVYGGCVLREAPCHFLYFLWWCFLPLTSCPSSGSEVAFMETWLDHPMRLLAQLTQLWGKKPIFFCLLGCVWVWVFMLPCNVLVQAVDMTFMCICCIFVGMCAFFVCVSYTCPVHCDSCTQQQGWTYLQCHPQTWG